MITTYDLCLAWNWEYDAPFVELLEASCRARGRTLLQVTPATLERTLDDLAGGRVAFRALLDRTSEGDPRFLPVVEWAHKAGVLSVNAYEQARRAWDKSLMHDALFSVVRTPYTIVLPPHVEQAMLDGLDLTPLGDCFSIKPAHGGGGDGVIVEAHTLGDVLKARVSYPADKYLLQTHVHPARLGNRVAWFRVIYCAGEVYPCWWDVTSHLYIPVTAAEESHYGLAGLRSITATVARVTGMRLFSTEIALTPEGELVTVDYANDPIDLRLQSRCVEGVPDDIARFVAERLVALASEGSVV